MRSGHEEIREMLPEYLKGSLTEEVRTEVESHVKDCLDCKGEVSFIREIVTIDVADPGDFFWKFLPGKVRLTVETEKADRSRSLQRIFRFFGASLRVKSVISGWLPAAAAILLLLVLTYTYTHNREIPEQDPFFKDPLTASVLYYSDVTEEDIPLLTEKLTGDELSLPQENLSEYSYYREFASLSSRELDSLYEVLKREQKAGG